MSRISSPTLSNVQVLILLSLADELHAWDARGAESMAWRRIGTGLRMALELGLHRAVSSKVVPRPQRHRRQRVWGACVFADRWLSLRLGQPHTINLADADAPPPFPYPDHIDPAQSSTVVPSFQLFCELTRLSEFLGKACNLVCTPSWLERADDVSLLLWQNNFETWLEALPTNWRYDLRCLTEASQVLNALVVTVMFTFYQSLIWPIRPIPSHITFRPPQRRKQDLIRRSQEVIIWAEGSGQFYIDTLSFIPYAVGE
ncbi:hypothetical protein TREMEDRAFT_30245 [Tremella mesenterica DSM 1558]|uniref:uncharacterized protein n=1 Tax=Tremella mesenterica (strain ATCC 24925 / CBS 8224 / DSM 1558 / NBRC 9311 / NRRL Y-6157 / RJB 2259-6 / UBC 559-6) TaxID=578456 RepID=UPI0003F4A121|nr:uncharacterized protein TREMEDRAFT_30245 [Tremella mesenterica DSM 1558]EIW70114.1 hypothetical protein TREMEDRAFT_30245 [Tremella mesenterica DSM 1558]